MKNLFKKYLTITLCLISVFYLVSCNSSNVVTNDDSTNIEKVENDITTTTNVLNLRTESADTVGDTTVYPWGSLGLTTSLMYRSLFIAESDLTTVNPDLAESYSVSEDGLQYTFVIDSAAMWSDGTQLTAKDVEFSIKTALKSSQVKSIFTNLFILIEGADMWRDGTSNELSGVNVEENVISISLTTPYSLTLPTLAQFVILPEHKLENVNPLELHTNIEFFENPITSGAYKLKELNMGNYYILNQNEYYNGTTPKIQEIVVHTVTDLVLQAQANKLDYTNTNVSEELNQLQAMNFLDLYPIEILFYRYFIVNMEGVDGNQNEAMQDIRVRQAILHAIDRDAIAEGLFTDLALIINSGVQNTDPIYNGFEYEYNPEKAKQLILESNYDMSRPITILYYYDDQTTIDLMDALSFYLGEIGLKVESYKSSTGAQDLFYTRNYDLGYKGLSAFNITEWYSEYDSYNIDFRNIFGGDTIFDNLNNELRTTSNDSQKNEILKELQTIEQENLYKIPLFTLKNNIFINERIKIPQDVTFANPWFSSNVKFEEWEIVS